MFKLPVTAATVLAAFLSVSATAAPRTPTDLNEVLAAVPTQRATSNATLSANETQQRLANYLRQFRQQDDPRYLGQAKGLLNRFVQSGGELTPALLLERASISESEHAFDAALTDLKAVIESEPRNAQAWLNRATIERLQGKYGDSLKSCRQVTELYQRRLGISCTAVTESLTGKAAQSYETLRQLARGGDMDTRSWYAAMLGDIAVRLGQLNAAEQQYRSAISLAPSRSYARRELADLLLSQQRPEQVLELVAGKQQSDAMLLRLTLAKKQLNDDFAAEAAELASRYRTAQQRGDNAHLRDQALFALDLRQDSETALELAKQNWQSQRETVDLLLLLRAALAAGDQDTVKLVAEWQQQHNLEDQRMTKLLDSTNG